MLQGRLDWVRPPRPCNSSDSTRSPRRATESTLGHFVVAFDARQIDLEQANLGLEITFNHF